MIKEILNVDSSVSSLDFYLKNGFIKKSDILLFNGMKYISMVKYR